MKKNTLLFLFFISGITSNAQYKNDNVAFKTVFPQDLCNELIKQTGYVILDVRSKGEYEDTSMMGMNIGRFKEALNFNVRELGQHISELASYKNQPVFVYCSHSQRSRRASKMLADSGFTNVLNINGGMTAIQQFAGIDECLRKRLETKNVYHFISDQELCQKITVNNKNIFLLDVRTDSAYNHISTDAKVNAYGTFKNAVHIPLADIESAISRIPADKEIVLIDVFGDDAELAAALLAKQHYKNVAVLLEGIDRFLYTDRNEIPCLETGYISPVPYHVMSMPEFKRFAETSKTYKVLDIRTAEEFTNKYKDSWRNIGHIKNAINIPAVELENQVKTIEAYKLTPIVLYSFGNSAETYEAANTLFKKGFTNINVLAGGLFNVRWTAANVKGNSSLFEMVTDVPEVNL